MPMQNTSPTGTAGNDVIISSNNGAQVLDGGAGNDRIITDGEGDTLLGGSGNDIADLHLQNYAVDFTIDISAELAQTDNKPASVTYDIGSGVAFLNSIEQLFFYGGAGNDNITGGAFNDRLDGGSGRDTLNGGAGNDALFGHQGNASINGGAGADVITIDGYVDLIDGGTDTLPGAYQNGQQRVDYSVIDKLYINGTAGFDAAGHVGDIRNVEQVFVKAGLGQISFSRDTAPQSAAFTTGGSTAGSATALAGLQIYVADVSDGAGGYLGSTIIGTEQGDTISGGKGNDNLIGNKGADTLLGGDGNDTLSGGIGKDSLDGGAGDDLLIVNSGPDQQPDVKVNGGAGNDKLNLNERLVGTELTADFSTGNATVNGTTFTSIESLYYDGSELKDTVTGTNQADQIFGHGGNDVVTGGGGNDTLWGGPGTDTAVYSGNYTDYTITAAPNANAFTTVQDNVANRDGTDSLKEFETLQFADGTYDVASKSFTLFSNVPA